MVNKRCAFFAVLLSSLNLLHDPVVSHAQTLFFFGDSLYDTGNKQYLSQRPVAANSAPYGVSVGKPTGRWSDGLIIPDYVAEFFGIPNVPPILEPKANLSNGANFAVAGASVLGQSFETMTLRDQVEHFAASNDSWTDEERSDGIYLFYIGSVDYLEYARRHSHASQRRQRRFVNRVVAGIEEALIGIHTAGGRKFAIQTLAPLGCLPIVKNEHPCKRNCVDWISDLAARHNTKLSQVLENLERNLDGFLFTVYDYFGFIQKRVEHSETYTFKEAKAACCGRGNLRAKGCGRRRAKVCEEPEDYLFFDGKHITQEANKQAAHLMFSANPGVIGPNNLRELYVLPPDISVKLGTKLRAEETDDEVEKMLISDTRKMSMESGISHDFYYQLKGATLLM